jgi:hypothetical protein
MGVKWIITHFQHIKKRTFSEIETIRHSINNCYGCFVNITGVQPGAVGAVQFRLKLTGETVRKKF